MDSPWGAPSQRSPFNTMTKPIPSYMLITLGAIIRVLCPIFFVEKYILWIQFSGALWVAAYILAATVLIPMLLTPRVDGEAY